MQQRVIPSLENLPRPLFARSESMDAAMTTPYHSHPWAQLSYAIRGWLSVETEVGNYIAPPQRAIWIPGGIRHQVSSSAGTEMRSLYLQPGVTPWDAQQCRVIEVSPLIRELICHFAEINSEYDEQGAEGRLVQVLLDQLAAAPEVSLSLPLPHDTRLRQLCQQLQQQPQNPQTLRQWGEQLGASEKTLSRLFLRDTGMTFRAWRQRLRLLESLTALEQGRPVSDVALASGYESTSAFIAAFHQHFGQTPGSFFQR